MIFKADRSLNATYSKQQFRTKNMSFLRHLQLVLVLLVGWGSETADAQDRTALIIANFDYGDHRLSQVQADAAVVAEALKREGFRVTTTENVAGKDLKDTVERFARRTATGGAAVLYFSGLTGDYRTYQSKGAWWTHLQGAGRPAEVRNPERESLSVDEVLKLFAENSSARTNLLVVDNARSNPFLAERRDRPTGSIALDISQLGDHTSVLFASRPGHSTDGLSDSSRLATALAARLPLGETSIGKMIAEIISDVERTSGGKQNPCSTATAKVTAWTSLKQRSFLNSETPGEGFHPGQEWINASGMIFCWCPPGKFVMGKSGVEHPDFNDAKPVEVTLAKGFWMGKYETAQIESRRVGLGPNSSFTKHKLAPLQQLSHDYPRKVIDALTKTESQAGRLPPGWEYAIPTEAEWEYACRAGSTAGFSFGNDADQLFRFANYADASLLADDGAMQFADRRFNDGVGKSPAIVGSYLPNAWGLHDMHGNLAEWCADRYLPYLSSGLNPLVDAKFKDATNDAVVRGGSWCSTATYCEAAFRNFEFVGKQRDHIGFRLVLRQK